MTLQGRFGSVAREAGIRAETAAAKVQVMWNKLQNLAILIGEHVLPFLVKMAEGLSNLVDAAAAFASANPGLTAAALAIGSIAAAVILALPVVAALAKSVSILKRSSRRHWPGRAGADRRCCGRCGWSCRVVCACVEQVRVVP